MGSRLVFGPLGIRPLLVVEEDGTRWLVRGNDVYCGANRHTFGWLGAPTGRPAEPGAQVLPLERSDLPAVGAVVRLADGSRPQREVMARVSGGEP